MRAFDEAAFDRLSRLGDRLRTGLNEIVRITGVEAHVRGAASIVGLFQGPETGPTYRDVVRARERNSNRAPRTELFFRHMLDHGVLMGAPGFLVLSTALDEADIDYILDQALKGFRLIRGEPQ